jgi:hypothetical protein
MLNDQTTSIIQLYALIELGEVVLSAPTESGSLSCFVDDATGMYSGACLELFQVSGTRWSQPCIIDVNSGTGEITLDRHFQDIFESGTETAGYFGSRNLAVSGTVETPIIARAFNKDLAPDNEWDISEFAFHVENGTAMADGQFGDIAKLKYGVQVRGVSNIRNSNVYNFKTNHDLTMFADWGLYSIKAGGGSSYGWTWKKHIGGQGNLGVVNRWSPVRDVQNYVELVIMDNLEALDVVEFFFEGSVVLP